jgi:hypothetical protein
MSDRSAEGHLQINDADTCLAGGCKHPCRRRHCPFNHRDIDSGSVEHPSFAAEVVLHATTITAVFAVSIVIGSGLASILVIPLFAFRVSVLVCSDEADCSPAPPTTEAAEVVRIRPIRSPR